MRADALVAASICCRLLGPRWLLGPSPLRRPTGPPPRAASGESIAPTQDAERRAATPVGEGALLALLLQLSSVEFAMCLYDQPADAVPPAVSALLPEVCSLLEEALFRLHADADDSEGGEAEEGGGGGAPLRTCWLDALADDELLSAQRAFHAAAKTALDYVEAVAAEAATEAAEAAAASAPVSAPHPLMLPVCRLLSAWLVQPSASSSLELYDRACAALPALQAAARDQLGESQAEWATQLRSFEREPRAAPPSAGAPPPSDETMALLFARLASGGGGAEATAMLSELEKLRAG